MNLRGHRRDITDRVVNQVRLAGWRLGRRGLDAMAPNVVSRRGPGGDTPVRVAVSGRRRSLGGASPSRPDGERPLLSETTLGTLDLWSQELLADLQEGTGEDAPASRKVC